MFNSFFHLFPWQLGLIFNVMRSQLLKDAGEYLSNQKNQKLRLSLDNYSFEASIVRKKAAFYFFFFNSQCSGVLMVYWELGERGIFIAFTHLAADCMEVLFYTFHHFKQQLAYSCCFLKNIQT